jgi:hypothetical protein
MNDNDNKKLKEKLPPILHVVIDGVEELNPAFFPEQTSGAQPTPTFIRNLVAHHLTIDGPEEIQN